MRVLLLHNRYRAEGGEERAVAEIVALLARRGHAVEVLERSSAAAGALTATRSLLRGGAQPEEVADAVRRMRAEIVHAHNVHPLFGWRALAAARAAGARTVLHLHNFRLFCAVGVAYRDGRPCFRCRGADTLPGLRLRCRGSLGEAAVYAAGLHVQQPRLYEHADRFVTLSGAHRVRLQELGLPVDGRTDVLPNFLASDRFAAATRAPEGSFALVAGRLVPEKGFDTAIAAARAAGVPVVVAGAGPDEPRLRALAAGGDVRFAGWVPAPALAGLRAGAAVALAPSRWEEPCPYSVLEALAAGLPVLASDLGGLPEIVGSDSALPPGDVAAWTEGLAGLWGDPDARRRVGSAGLADARLRFGEDRYYDELMGVYSQALAG
jgi:glycosyltransferase involved in cell wall biosynthesis